LQLMELASVFLTLCNNAPVQKLLPDI
jgi:hypothetical protein